MPFNQTFEQPKGIYQQIADQICERIINGEYQSNEKLPSVRELAVSLQVNPNTVVHSYQFLVDKQIVKNHRGRGHFVSENAQMQILQELKIRFIKDDIPRIFATMEKVGICIDELIELYQSEKNKEKKQ